MVFCGFLSLYICGFVCSDICCKNQWDLGIYLNIALLKVEQGHFETAILILHNFFVIKLRLQVLGSITCLRVHILVWMLLQGISDQIRLSQTIQHTYFWVLFHLLQLGRVCYPVLQGVTPCYPLLLLVTLCYSVLPIVTPTLPCFTLSFPVLPVVTQCYLLLPCVTLCYAVLPCVTPCYPVLPGVTPCNPLLPRVTQC